MGISEFKRVRSSTMGSLILREQAKSKVVSKDQLLSMPCGIEKFYHNKKNISRKVNEMSRERRWCEGVGRRQR